MQASRRENLSRSLPHSIFDKFEGIYNEEQQQLKQNQNVQKHLLAKIMQRQLQEHDQRKRYSKQLEQQENKSIDLFWRNEEERRCAQERKHRMDIEQTRKVNNTNFNQLLSKSMSIDPYHLQKSYRDDLKVFQEQQMQKKQLMKQYYQEAMQVDAARQQKKRYERQISVMTDRKKEDEDRQLNARRQDYYMNWRNKHFQDKHVQIKKQIAELNHQKQVEKALLEEAIAVKGGHELNQRVAAMRAVQINEHFARKQDHLRQLKQQTQDNTYKAAIDRYLQVNYERKRMEEMSKVLEERDHKEKQVKKQLQNQVITTLKGQMKPRVLLQESDRIEPAGIGSPAHIGKIVHDDRIKQLKYIERSYLNELRHV